MADRNRKRDDEAGQAREAAPEKERFADQQFGATAARDQERAEQAESPQQELLDTDEPGEGVSGRNPRAGNKADPT